MKQVVYNFDWLTVAGALVAAQNVEDGFWQLNINTECVTIPMTQPVAEARPEVLPGHIVRTTGLQLRKVPDLGFMCVEVKNGLIREVGFDLNRNQSGPVESGQSAGEDSGSARVSHQTRAGAGFKPIDAR